MISIRAVAVDAPEARALIRSYLTEMVDRYHGRPMPASAVDEALAGEPADDVTTLLVAYREGVGVGCVGLRRAEERTGEITKMYVSPQARRLGIGRRLLAAVENAARDQGLRTLRLDTRSDLVEARAMYAAHGYTEIPPHRDRRYADHWFAKELAARQDGGMAHSHDTVDWAARGPDLIADAEAGAPMVDQALGWLAQRVPEAGLVLDVGSGPGVAACRLAQLLPGSTVLAADGAAPLLALARARAERLGVGGQVTTREVRLPDGLAGLPPADLIWVSGVAHHLPDPAAGVRAFADRLRPGGLLALREGGLPLQYLPAAADVGLSARITAVDSALAHRHAHPMGVVEAPRSWPELLAEAGLTRVRSRSFLLDVPAPLPTDTRRYLARTLRRTRELLTDHLGADDLARLDTLTDEDRPESVLHRPDVFLLRAATVHTAVREA